MIERDAFEELTSQSEGREETSILCRKTASGAIKELAFCHRDRCFFVKVSGRERLRSDRIEMIMPYFNSHLPE
ncbi:hypothetical protein CU669_17000 [Paramagnetospirillum kuznetsovii]|uniref:Uncharacterized protein n=1 Tax=Paramagnetospirillum kuznetsovii TaxID=2053833 RepID=A0A364NUN3_9PROT|nr:hypothetical protein [Paramagnetospirillum kuznetsovii]RAU20776.1 hypothetical protein CU669_17000 [Paramagnetospirillum kuznetsovii]